MKTKPLLFLLATVGTVSGQPMLPLAPAADPPDLVTLGWDIVPEAAFYEISTAEGIIFARPTTNTVSFPVPAVTTTYYAQTVDSNGLESAVSNPATFYVPPPLTNVVTISATNWASVAWTNPPSLPPGLAVFLMVTNLTTNKVRVYQAPSPRGPWLVWTNFPQLTTTNRGIRLKISSSNL